MHPDRKASNRIEVTVLMCEPGLDNYGQIC